MGLDLAIGIARSGLAATQRALAQASQNIANAQTEGYTRKRIDAQAQDAGGQPQGVRSPAARRDVDLALLAERDARGAAAAAAGVRETLLAGIEAIQGRPEDGATLGNALGKLRETFTALRAAPADPELARAVLRRAEDTARQFQDSAGAIQTARQQAQQGIVDEVKLANDELRHIAELSGLIQSTMASGGSAADLEDKRDIAIARLAGTVPVRALRQADGGVVLVGRNGLSLPLPTRDEDMLSTIPAQTGPSSYYGAGGNLPGVMLGRQDITQQLTGGKLAEYITLRDRVLPRMQAELDVAAVELAGRLDAQGLRLFTDAGGQLPDRLGGYVAGGQAGFALTIRVNPSIAPNALAVRDGTHAVAGGPGGPTGFIPNPPGGPAGFTAMIDRVLDHALGDSAAPGTPWGTIASAGLGPDGTLISSLTTARSVEDYATQLVRAQTEARAEATSARATATAMQAGIASRIDRQSGVDPDAEMAAMVQLQNAYAANARVLSTAQAMWDALLGAIR